MAKALDQLGDLVMAIRRELDAPAIVIAVTSLRESYDELDGDLRVTYRNGDEWRHRGTWLQTVFEEITGHAGELQQAVLAVKAELEDPL